VGVLERLKQAWKRDRLGVLGVSSAVVAFGLWAWPSLFYLGSGFCYTYETTPTMLGFTKCSQLGIGEVNNPTLWLNGYFDDYVLHLDRWFQADRMPAASAFVVLAVILLLLRRR
jgi:hypothetical protein